MNALTFPQFAALPQGKQKQYLARLTQFGALAHRDHLLDMRRCAWASLPFMEQNLQQHRQKRGQVVSGGRAGPNRIPKSKSW